MKTILVVLLVLLFTALVGAQDEWLGCDLPDPTQNVTHYDVSVDSAPSVRVPLQLSASGNDVLLWDVTGISSAHFEVWAVNDKGARSETSSPFDLARPDPPSSGRIVGP